MMILHLLKFHLREVWLYTGTTFLGVSILKVVSTRPCHGTQVVDIFERSHLFVVTFPRTRWWPNVHSSPFFGSREWLSSAEIWYIWTLESSSIEQKQWIHCGWLNRSDGELIAVKERISLSRANSDRNNGFNLFQQKVLCAMDSFASEEKRKECIRCREKTSERPSIFDQDAQWNQFLSKGHVFSLSSLMQKWQWFRLPILDS